MATASDLSMLTSDELGARLGDSRRELFNLRFQLATGQLDNPARLGQVKRDVARMLTVLRTREILEAEGTYVAPTAAEHEAARAKLEAEDAAQAEKAEARRAAAEAEAGGEELPEEFDEFDESDEFDEDDEDDEEEEEA
jgi:large subunit ribosomal protein L29